MKRAKSRVPGLKDPQASLKKLRKKIDAADRALIKALGSRMATVEKIGEVKIAAGMPLLQKSRWKEVMDERLQAAAQFGLAGPFTTALYSLIHHEALRIQSELQRKVRKNR